MKKKLSIITALVLCLSVIFSVNVFAASWPAKKNIQTYGISTKNNTPVYKTTKSNDGSYGTIYASDLITILGYDSSSDRFKVSYPTSKGSKTGYVKRTAITKAKVDQAEKFTADAKYTAYRRSSGSATIGYVAKGDVCYKLTTENGRWQVIYPIKGGYKMGWIKITTPPTPTPLNNYEKKVKAFTSDSRWKNGTKWTASQKPKLSTYSASGCCAYAVDFCKYVFGKNSYTSGNKFSNPKDIRDGDIIKVTGSQHWFVVLERNGNKLKTAEGNWGGKVVISNSTYSISGNTLYRNGKKFRTFAAGYHMQ